MKNTQKNNGQDHDGRRSFLPNVKVCLVCGYADCVQTDIYDSADYVSRGQLNQLLSSIDGFPFGPDILVGGSKVLVSDQGGGDILHVYLGADVVAEVNISLPGDNFPMVEGAPDDLDVLVTCSFASGAEISESEFKELVHFIKQLCCAPALRNRLMP